MTIDEIMSLLYNWWAINPLFTIEDRSITISTLFISVLIIVLTLVFSKLLQRVVKGRLLARFRLDAGLEYALLRMLHYTILGFGIYVALTSIGLNLGALAGFLALLGVGIGFGLQNLTSNFISGIILLFERPVKIGDRITVQDVWGDVEKINLRTTVVNTVDNVSIIIPNSKLLEDNLVNWSYGDLRIRIHVPVGVAYGSNVDLVTRLLLEAAKGCNHVLVEPKSQVWFTEFGDSSLNFEIVCWLPDSKVKPIAIDEMNRAIDRLFRANKVEIPFPQRDLHIRSDATRNKE